jgi:Ca-activated chloride channel family protein
MSEKITTTKHIRQQLEDLHQQKYSGKVNNKQDKRKYQGLGLNWRTTILLIMALFYLGLYQVQAQDYFDLDDIDTGMMLSYHEQGNDYSALTLLSSQYDVDITGIVAQVKITQSFINDTPNWVEEGMYAFPVASNAAVYQMKLMIGKRVIEGEIHEKQQAQAIYEQAKSEGLAASIVKQYRPNLFTTDVANIMPNEIVKVEISYQQTLSYDAGHIDFRLPLAIKSRYMQERFLAADDSSDSQQLQLKSQLQGTGLSSTLPSTTVMDEKNRSININLEAGFELTDLVSLNHKVLIKQTDNQHSIQLNDATLYDNKDFVLQWYPKAGNTPKAALFSEKLNGEEYVLMMLLPPKSTQVNTQKREVVFIIDTSGSMDGNAMNAAKDALLFGLTQLDYEDKFNIIEFNSYARELFDNVQEVNTQNLDKAIDFIDLLRADGGTNMSPALALAMEDEVASGYLKQIIFITDGSVGNEAQLFSQINKEINNARLFTVAIGSAPNNYFMNKASLIGRGTYTSIADLSQVDKHMNELFVKLSSPALTDVYVEWNSAVEQNPRVIPDLYSDQPVMITAKMENFNTQVALSGMSNTKSWSKAFQLKKDGASKGIARLWARNQIEDLTDDLMLDSGIDRETVEQQITAIALQHHLISEFTSLVAVDRNPDLSRLVALQKRSEQNHEVLSQANFPQTALGWKLQLLIGLFLFLVAFALNRYKHES